MQVGGVQFPEPTLLQPPPFPKKKGTGGPLTPCPLVLKSPPPLNTPPPSPNAPLFNKICENANHLFWGFLESRLDMLRPTEDLVSSRCVTVNCGRSTKQMMGLWGFRTGRMACCIFNLQSHDYRADSGIPLETICRPTQFQLPIFQIILGEEAEEAGRCRTELSSVQLVHKFAATLSNTTIHKQFKNDKKGFWQIWALSRGPRGHKSSALVCECQPHMPARNPCKRKMSKKLTLAAVSVPR